MERIYPWGHSRRYNSYAEHFKLQFGHRVQKLTIDAGFSCPNRDGSITVGGCTYCNNDAFNPSYCGAHKSITQQLSEGVEFHLVRYRNAKTYLAYFQAFSNTHAPLEDLKRMYNEALNFPGVIGLVIGTRPDCVDEEKLDYLAELSRKYYIVVEYGVESVYNDVLEKINRGHDFEKSRWAIEESEKRGIKTGAHFIVGLQGEDRERTLESINIINSLPLHSLKFHQLQIFKNTAMEKQYQEDPAAFKLYGLDEFLELMVEIMERLNPAIVVERIAGEAPPWHLAAPGWGLLRVHDIVRMFEKKLKEKDSWQGKKYIISKFEN